MSSQARLNKLALLARRKRLNSNRNKGTLGPLSPDRWLEPGTRAFAVIFPELNWRYCTRTMTDTEVRR
jgi:hypothetical protein